MNEQADVIGGPDTTDDLEGDGFGLDTPGENKAMSTDTILSQIDDALEDWSVGPDAMRCNAPPGNRGLAFRPPRPSITQAQLGELSVRVAAAFQPFAEAMAKMARSLQAFVDSVPGLRAKLGLPPLHDEHHPAPLCIDGVAYHRRRRARRRRR